MARKCLRLNLLLIGLRAGRPEPSRYARPHRSLRSLALTFVPVPPLTMPRVARAPAIPPPPPLPALSLVLTGKEVYLVSVKKGRLLTPRPPTSGIWGCYVDGPHLKQPTVHVRGRFPGRSLLPTGDRPRWDLFSRTVAFQNKGPSTLEAISPAGQRLERGGVVQGDMPPPARGVPAKRMALCESRRRGSPVPTQPATLRRASSL